jgi:hypothetical protein
MSVGSRVIVAWTTIVGTITIVGTTTIVRTTAIIVAVIWSRTISVAEGFVGVVREDQWDAERAIMLPQYSGIDVATLWPKSRREVFSTKGERTPPTKRWLPGREILHGAELPGKRLKVPSG